MAIGGILAILFYKYPDYRFSVIQKAIVGFSTASILYKYNCGFFGLDNILAALVGGLILGCVNKQEFIILDHSIFLFFLGKISYGIYIYHVIGVFL
jgi:peptidoglycan/LPS O-acetylase OafA/YrhL